MLGACEPSHQRHENFFLGSGTPRWTVRGFEVKPHKAVARPEVKPQKPPRCKFMTHLPSQSSGVLCGEIRGGTSCPDFLFSSLLLPPQFFFQTSPFFSPTPSHFPCKDSSIVNCFKEVLFKMPFGKIFTFPVSSALSSFLSLFPSSSS